MAQPQKRSHKVRDFLLYVAIAVSIVVLAGLLGVHQAKTGQKPEILLEWIGFAVLTVLVFWWVIRAYRPFWATARFWRFIALFGAIHVVVLLPFVAITPLEYLLLSAFLSRCMVQKE
jgi:hypothetical protein